jgi:hypothetical protein
MAPPEKFVKYKMAKSPEETIAKIREDVEIVVEGTPETRETMPMHIMMNTR